MQLSKSIILIGMPGSGKTTVGKILAKRYGVQFKDTDNLIKATTGEALQVTLDKCGRDKFLDTENKVLLGINPDKPMIIATGGSAVLHKEAMEHLRSIGTVVFLDADLPLIRKRLWNMESRGIVFAEGEDESILAVYSEREPMYYKYSDIRVHIRGKTVESTAESIIKAIESNH